MYLGPCQTSMMEVFCQSNWFLVAIDNWQSPKYASHFRIRNSRAKRNKSRKVTVVLWCLLFQFVELQDQHTWLNLRIIFPLTSSQTHWFNTLILATVYRSSPSEVFLRKGVLKICSRFTREHPCRSVISMKLQSDFIEIALRHGCFPVNFLHIFRTFFCKNTSDGLLLS